MLSFICLLASAGDVLSENKVNHDSQLQKPDWNAPKGHTHESRQPLQLAFCYRLDMICPQKGICIESSLLMRVLTSWTAQFLAELGEQVWLQEVVTWDVILKDVLHQALCLATQSIEAS